MRRKLLLVGIGLFILIVMLLGVQMLLKSSSESKPRKVSDTFIQEVLTNKTSESYELFTTTAKNGLSQADWGDRVLLVSTLMYSNDPSKASTEKSGADFIFSYSVRGSDGEYKLTTHVTSVKDGWRVQEFTSTLQS